jgi:hypothetical protein
MFCEFENFLNKNYLTQEKEIVCQHVFYENLDTATCIKCNLIKNIEISHLVDDKKNNTIIKELENYNFPDSVTKIASFYFEKTCGDKIYRGSKRKGIICACVYHAYKKIGDCENFECIIKKFGLTYKKAAPGFKLVKMQINETRNEIESVSDVAKGIAHQLNLKFCDKLNSFFQTIPESDSIKKSVKQTRLHVAGLIFKFIKTQYKSSVKIEDFCSALQINKYEFERML